MAGIDIDVNIQVSKRSKRHVLMSLAATDSPCLEDITVEQLLSLRLGFPLSHRLASAVATVYLTQGRSGGVVAVGKAILWTVRTSGIVIK